MVNEPDALKKSFNRIIFIDRKKFKNLKVQYENLISFDNIEQCKNTVWSGELDGWMPRRAPAH